MDLQLDVTRKDGAAVVDVTGEVDVATTPKLRAALHHLADSDVRRIVVDIDAVEFIDSTGLGALIGCLRRLRSGGDDRDLVLVCTRPHILRVFTITGLDSVFAIVPTAAEALG